MSLDITLTDVFVEPPVQLESLNITNNLIDFAIALNCYECIWKPKNLNIITAYQLLPHLYEAYYNVIKYGDIYLSLLPKNGWGTKEQFLNFIDQYIEACITYPNTLIETST